MLLNHKFEPSAGEKTADAIVFGPGWARGVFRGLSCVFKEAAWPWQDDKQAAFNNIMNASVDISLTLPDVLRMVGDLKKNAEQNFQLEWNRAQRHVGQGGKARLHDIFAYYAEMLEKLDAEQSQMIQDHIGHIKKSGIRNPRERRHLNKAGHALHDRRIVLHRSGVDLKRLAWRTEELPDGAQDILLSQIQGQLVKAGFLPA